MGQIDFFGFSGKLRSFPALQRGLALPLCLLLCSAAALASDDFRLSGFGTLGHSADKQSRIAPSRDISQRPENGFSTGASWRLDSRVGVQLEYRVSPSVDLVGQIVLRDHFKADLDSTTELAYLAVRPHAGIDLRIGRINYDAFLLSDHRNVGYAYPWVRPPSEFYGWVPIFSIDGIDAAYSIHDGGANWRFKAQAANSRFSIPLGRDGYDFRADKLLGLSASRQSGFWRIKAAYSQFTVGSEAPALSPLHAGLDQLAAAGIAALSPEAAELRKNLSFKDARITYTTVGAAYDSGTWLAQAELGHTTANAEVIPHGNMAYLGVGRRLGDWTPYLLLSTSRPGHDLRKAANDWGALNATLRDPALFTLNTTRIEQNTVALGTRWDFHRQAALKLQWTSTLIKPSGYGLWWRDTALNNQRHRVNQLSATLDFAF